jgi:hypothetical protein
MTDLTQFSIPEGCHIGRKKDGLNDEVPEGCNNVHAVTSLRDFAFKFNVNSLPTFFPSGICSWLTVVFNNILSAALVNYTRDFA